MTGSFSNKQLNPSGDFYVLEGSINDPEIDWKFIYGTGKFKGITGAGKSIHYTKGKPVTPGTSQSCAKVTGTFELKIGMGRAGEAYFYPNLPSLFHFFWVGQIGWKLYFMVQLTVFY